MLYFSMLGFFLMFSFVSKRNEVKKLYLFSMVTLLLIAMLRFGLGTDYFTYYAYYDVCNASSVADLTLKNYILSQVEPLYFLCQFIFKFCHLSYEVFVAFCAMVAIIFTYRAILNISKAPLLSLFIFFANYYLIEVQNMVRQGMAMALFLFALSEWIQTKKTKRYLFIILVACGFHFSAIICFFVPFITTFPQRWFFNYVSISVLCIFSLAIGFVVPKILIMIISKIFPRYAYYKMGSFNILAAGLRLVELFLVVLLRDKAKKTETDLLLYKLFILGIFLSLMCMTMDVLTRLTEHLLFIEILLIPNLLVDCGKNKKTIMLPVFLLLYSFLFTKDVNSFSKQGNFLSCTEIYEYPYVTVFNKDRIKEIRPEKDWARYFRSW